MGLTREQFGIDGYDLVLNVAGYIPESDEYGSLKVDFDIPSEYVPEVLEVMGWPSLEGSPDGEWALTDEQRVGISKSINMDLPDNLELFISVCSV